MTCVSNARAVSRMSRRSFFGVLTGAIAAPMIVPVSSLMPVKQMLGLINGPFFGTVRIAMEEIDPYHLAMLVAGQEWERLMLEGSPLGKQIEPLALHWKGKLECAAKITTTSPSVAIRSLG